MRRLLIPAALTAIAAASLAADLPPDSLKWSTPETEKTPAGNVTFHGAFANDTVRVTANALPAHAFVEITMDLLILRSWDGSYPMSSHGRPVPSGPDFFRLALADGPTLLYTTFSNRPDNDGFDDGGKFQSYPSQVPGAHLAPQSGAAAKNSLGYNYPWLGAPQLFPMDATYRLRFVVPHTAASATLEMTAMNLGNLIDESWGVTDVHVRPLPVEALDKVDLGGIAKAFAGALDTANADQPAAFQSLINGMDDTVDWIHANVQPQPIDAAKMNDAIKNLYADDSGIRDREKAGDDLRTMGPQIEPALRDARRSAPAEVRTRIDWLLQYVGTTEIADENVRRVLLATRVLEIIGTPRALELRKHLVEG